MLQKPRKNLTQLDACIKNSRPTSSQRTGQLTLRVTSQVAVVTSHKQLLRFVWTALQEMTSEILPKSSFLNQNLL